MNKKEYNRIQNIKAYNKLMKEKYPINKELRKQVIKERRESQKKVKFTGITVIL